MNTLRSLQTTAFTTMALLLWPAAAHASGGWEGVTTLIGLLALPALFVVIIALGIMLAVKKGHRVAGVVGAILGALCALWQLFWFRLEPESSSGFATIGFLCNVVVFVLVGLHFRAAGRLAAQPPQGPQR